MSGEEPQLSREPFPAVNLPASPRREPLLSCERPRDARDICEALGRPPSPHGPCEHFSVNPGEPDFAVTKE